MRLASSSMRAGDSTFSLHCVEFLKCFLLVSRFMVFVVSA